METESVYGLGSRPSYYLLSSTRIPPPSQNATISILYTCRAQLYAQQGTKAGV